MSAKIQRRGDVGKNLLTSYAAVETVLECGALCTDNLDCEFITHFGPDSFPFRNYCMLFSECGRLADCKDCTTSTNSGSLKFVEPFDTLVNIIALGDC